MKKILIILILILSQFSFSQSKEQYFDGFGSIIAIDSERTCIWFQETKKIIYVKSNPNHILWAKYRWLLKSTPSKDKYIRTEVVFYKLTCTQQNLLFSKKRDSISKVLKVIKI